MTNASDGTVTSDGDLYYDPYDIEIDNDPYPTWKRLRDEAPLYYNEHHDFYALSRFDDVEAGLVDPATYSSGKGTILELIKSGIEFPPGLVLFEDPPLHDVHRGLLSRVFTPKAMSALEPTGTRVLRPVARPLRRCGWFRLRRRPRCRRPDVGHRHAAGDPGNRARDHPRHAQAAGPRRSAGREADRHRGDRRDLRRLHRLAGRPPLRRPHDEVAHDGVHRRDRHDPAARAHRGPPLHEHPRGRGQRDRPAPHRLDRSGAREITPTSGAPSRPIGRWFRTRSRNCSGTRARHPSRRAW